MIARAGEVALVTGGAGFIGSHLVDRLLEVGSVVVVDDFSTGSWANVKGARTHQGCIIHEVDVRSKAFGGVVAAVAPSVIYHLAAQVDVRYSMKDPVLDADVNVQGTVNVLEAARQARVGRVVIASSGGCIYGEAEELPIPEKAPTLPESPYGLSKLVKHGYADLYSRVFGLPTSVLALANVYGPRQDPKGEAGVVSIFLGAMLEERRTIIYGDGQQTRDYLFVEDAVEALLRAGQAEAGGVFNVGTGIQTTVIDLHRACAQVTGTQMEPAFAPPRQGELRRNALDSTRARDILAWAPTVDLPLGLARTAAYLAQRLETEAGPRSLSGPS